MTVNFQGITGTDWNDFFTKILTRVAAGDAPDLAFVATEGVQLFAQQQLAHPLTEFVKRDADELTEYFSDVHPALIEAMMYGGDLYELPSAFNAANMYFNTSLLEAAGGSLPDPDWTIRDFESLARQFKKNSAITPFNWVVRLWGSWSAFMYANGGNLLKEAKFDGGDWLWDKFYQGDAAAKGRGGGWKWGDPTATDSKVVEALDYVIDLSKSGLSAQPDVGGGNTLQGLFSSNQIGMTIGGGFWAGGLHNAGMANGSFDVQYFPKWRKQKAIFGTGGYGMFESAKDKELAWEFLKTMVSTKSIGIQVGENTTTPARRSMMTAERYSETGPSNWKTYYNTLDKLEGTMPIPAPPYYNQLAVALNQRTTQAISSGDAASALRDLQGDLERAAAAA